jgi:hypothetical protein
MPGLLQNLFHQATPYLALHEFDRYFSMQAPLRRGKPLYGNCAVTKDTRRKFQNQYEPRKAIAFL